jgi:biopolymer transport protein ExbD
MIKAARLPHAEPIGAINVTPFIDVLLVLMIMIILTIPIQSHKVPIDLPAAPTLPTPPTPPLHHELAIDRAGALSWDGQPISDAVLPALLTRMAAEDSTELHLRTDPETRYERFDAVLATVKRANVTRLGFVGNETMRD